MKGRRGRNTSAEMGKKTFSRKGQSWGIGGAPEAWEMGERSTFNVHETRSHRTLREGDDL